MSKLLKTILVSFSILLAIIILAAVFFVSFFDVNDFKPEIEAIVFRHTGKQLIVEGDLNLSIFPWLGISTGKLLLVDPSSGAENQQPLVSIKEGSIKVKLLPLLRKKIEVSTVILKNPVVFIHTDKQGKNNWQFQQKTKKSTVDTIINRPDTGNSSTKSTDIEAKKNKQRLFVLNDLIVSGVRIENGQVQWRDERKNSQLEINQFDFNIDRLAFEQQAPFELTFKYLPQQMQPVLFNGKGKIAVTKDFNQFRLEDLEIELLSKTTANRLNFLAQSKLLAYSRATQSLKIPELVFSSKDIKLTTELTANQIRDNPVYLGKINISKLNLRRFLGKLGKSISAPDEKILTQLLGSFEVVTSKEKTRISNIKLQVDDSTIQGNFKISNYKQPFYNFDIFVDNISFDNYAELELDSVHEKQEIDSSATTKNKAEDHLPTKVRTPKPETLKQNVKQLEKPILPVDLLRKINASGRLTIKKGIYKGLKLNNLVIDLDAGNGVLKTSHSISPFYQGKYVGHLQLSVKNKKPSIRLDEKLTQVRTGPLLKDFYGKTYLSGLLNGRLKFQGIGNTKQALKKNSTGNITVVLKDGKIYGFNLQEIVKKGKAILKNKDFTETKKYTEFSIIKASALIKNGLVKNDDFYAESKRLRVSGKGTFNLLDEKLDYHVLAKLMKRNKSVTEAGQVKRTLGIQITGPLKQLVYTFDLKSLITEKEKQKLIDKAEKKLGKEVGNLLKQLLQ